MATEKKNITNTKESADSVVTEKTKNTATYIPNVDISETKESLVIFADIPGATEDSIQVTLDNDILTIDARVAPETINAHKLTYREYGVGDYSRAFTINESIDREKIEAKIKDGVLRIVLPKAEAAKPKTIPIHKG
ncbi:MAG: Hsp20/alpha crystallin family protein [Deltaproteobacteria bacterium]|nr:Hsp20/alpha crystallin family protein [Deltaproteobacteria bacterium]